MTTPDSSAESIGSHSEKPVDILQTRDNVRQMGRSTAGLVLLASGLTELTSALHNSQGVPGGLYEAVAAFSGVYAVGCFAGSLTTYWAGIRDFRDVINHSKQVE